MQSFPVDTQSPDSPQSEVYSIWHVCRSVESTAAGGSPLEPVHAGIRTIEFRKCDASNLTFAIKNPPSLTPIGAYCFYACPPLPKPEPYLKHVFSTIRPRLEQLLVKPAMPDEFIGNEVLACESLGHEARIKASVESDPERRKRLLRRAEFMYEAALRMVGHRTVLLMLDRMIRHPDEVYVVRVNDSADSMSHYLKRLITSSFAGLAICAMYLNDFPRFGSCASLAAGWDDVGGIFALNTIRVIAILDNRLEMYLFLTRNVLLPYLMRTNRAAIVEEELRTCVPDEIVDGTRDMVMALATRFGGPIPPEGTHVRTRIIDGRVVERLCVVCDATGKVRHCARCKAVYYCSKECQVAHWPEHKAMCEQYGNARHYGEDMYIADASSSGAASARSAR